jgi:acyl-CoA dehydrogenase
MSEFADELTELIANLVKDVDDPPDGQLPGQWRQIQELGLVGIGIDEESGGSGGELDDLVVVIRELARAGVGTPIVEASTAAFAIGMAEHDSFDTIVVNHVANLSSPILTADLGLVPFATLADRLVIVGDSEVAVVPLSQPGVAIDAKTDVSGLPVGRVRLSRVSCQPVQHVSDLDDVIERLTLARSAALLGCAYGAYDLTRRYVTEREQFGAPLIKIPAVSAALAQMSVTIRNAQSAVDRAISIAADADSTPLRRFGAVAGARIATGRMASLVARTAHQLHGAVGVTLEYGLHRFTRKLWAWRDADTAERVWSSRFGATVLSVDEAALWDEISA